MRKSSNLAFLAAVVLSAHFAGAAQMVDLRALPKYGDSSLMSFNRREARDTTQLMTFGLPSPAPSFTTVFWTCVEWDKSNTLPFIQAMISTEPALYVSEGGDYSPDLLGDAYWPVERGGLGATLPLSSTGTWSANCLPASYDMPEALRDKWQYGCYTLNIITDTDLTVTVGGEERNIAASNEMQQVAFLCVSTDRSITVAAADADADVYLCAAESPLRQFHGMQIFDTSTSFETSFDGWGAPERSLTNEWRMVVLRGAIVQGGAAVELNALTFAAVDPSPIEDSTSTKELWRPRADRCFARHSRIGFTLASFVGLKDHSDKYIRRNVWGAKLYPEWLDDDLILSIRDKDWAEMQRRGFSTHYQFSQ